MKNFIAKRRLAYSLKGGDSQNEFFIGFEAPYVVTQEMVQFKVGESLFGCCIGFDGIDEKPHIVYGADSLQAVQLASKNIETFLKRLQKKYDFYWLSGEPYFEDNLQLNEK